MAFKLEHKGLCLHAIKLDGELQVRLTVDEVIESEFSLCGTESVQTQTKDMRQAGNGHLVKTGGLEVYVEQVKGKLRLVYKGNSGASLSYEVEGEERKSTQLAEIEPEEVDAVEDGDEFDGAGYADHAAYANGNEVLVMTPEKGIGSQEQRATEERSGSKRKRDASTDYRTYKHLFMEGYFKESIIFSTFPGKLHVDLQYHKLYWEQGDVDTMRRVALPILDETVEHTRDTNQRFYDPWTTVIRLRKKDKKDEHGICVRYHEAKSRVWGSDDFSGAKKVPIADRKRFNMITEAIHAVVNVKYPNSKKREHCLS